MREKQRVLKERHENTIRACLATKSGDWEQASKYFSMVGDDSSAIKKKVLLYLYFIHT
jgi:hypothetical protein